jgi:hypothetical protein
MEQPARIGFFTLKGLKARASLTELESGYGPEALALPTVKKWRTRFHQVRTNLFDGFRCRKVLTNDLGEVIIHACRKAVQVLQGSLSPCPY